MKLLKIQNSKFKILRVGVIAVLGYLVIFGLFYQRTWDLRDFILIGQPFISRSNASTTITIDPNYKYYENGYDGQFAYFIATDPLNARFYMGSPNDSYRYTRILYPIVARLLAFGNPPWIPASLILVNLLAIFGGTWAVAAWCQKHRLSPWLALVYAFFVGQVTAFTRDLNEISAYALVAIGFYLFDQWPRQRLWAGIIFGLAALARETTLVFPVLLAVRLFFDTRTEYDRDRAGATVFLFAVIAVIPLLLWQLILYFWMGTFGLSGGTGLLRLPYAGLYDLYPFSSAALEVVQVIIVPATLCIVVVIWNFWKNKAARRQIELWVLLVNALLFALMLHPSSLQEIYAAGRISTGVTLAAIYSLPYTRRRMWFYACAGLWLAPTVSILITPLFEVIKKVLARGR